MHGTLLDHDTGEPESTAERIALLLFELQPAARELACSHALDAAWSLLDRPGAHRQRAAVAREGIEALVPWLVSETAKTLRKHI